MWVFIVLLFNIAELTEFLNYDKYEIAGKNSGNSRNGNYSHNLQAKYGVIENLEVPRDRNNDFQTALFEPYKRRDNWLEQTVIRCMPEVYPLEI